MEKWEMDREQDLISIIVPVYNVENYLNDCIISIVNQTYRNLEIILINDGSQDGSELICTKWAQSDGRIIYVRKRNETLGPTRNLGIQMAKGKYISFVDADDWIDANYIEKLYKCVKEEDRDFAKCGYVEMTEEGMWNNLDGISFYPYDSENIKKIIASGMGITIVTGLYKKNLWVDNHILMPPGPHQDLAILGLVYVYAQKIGVCDECLYYYRVGRKESTTEKTKGTVSILRPLQHLVEEYKNRGLFEKYRKELLMVCIGKIYILTNRLSKEMKDEYMGDIKGLFQNEFGVSSDFFENGAFAVGGYNVQRILSGMFWMEDAMKVKFQHSSIISIMSNRVQYKVKKGNLTFREKMIASDWNKDLIEKIRSGKIKYLLLDFIEERYDVIEMEKDAYVTYSEALEEKGYMAGEGKFIRRASNECLELWKKSCKNLINLLKTFLEPKNVFMIKFYLAEGYGINKKDVEYENIQEIREMNRLLEKYYSFFEENFKGINIIEVPYEELYTDNDAIHGRYPWHLNRRLRFEIEYKLSHGNLLGRYLEDIVNDK